MEIRSAKSKALVVMLMLMPTSFLLGSQKSWYLEALCGLEPMRQEEFGYSEKWQYYSRGFVYGLSAGLNAGLDVSINATLKYRIRPYNEHTDSNSWYWTTTLWRGKPAVIGEIIFGPRLHFKEVSKGTYLQFAGGIQAEKIGKVTGDVYNWGRTVYLGEELRPESFKYRPIGSVLLGYDIVMVGRIYLGIEASVLLTFDKVESSYLSIAKIGYRFNGQ